jgi:predicted ATPase
MSSFLGRPASDLLTREISQMLAGGVYDKTVFFIRNQGFVEPTAARRIGFEDSVAFERLHEQTYRDLGFQLIDVPPGPLADRAAVIQQIVGPPVRREGRSPAIRPPILNT